MKRIVVVAMAAMAAFVLGSTEMAKAADTATVNATATVIGVCTMGADVTIDFGQLDPVLAPAVGPTAPSAPLTVNCGPGTLWTVAGGFAGTMAGPGPAIPFGLAYTAAGSGTGVDQDLGLTGSLAAGSYLGRTPGVYAGTVVLSVTP